MLGGTRVKEAMELTTREQQWSLSNAGMKPGKQALLKSTTCVALSEVCSSFFSLPPFSVFY